MKNIQCCWYYRTRIWNC